MSGPTLHIGNKSFALDRSLAEKWQPEDTWQKTIRDTVGEWYDDKDFITIATSGTTGSPKLIDLPKSTMRQSALLTAQAFSLQSGSKALLCLPAHYIAGKMMVIRAIVNDWDLHAQAPSSLPELDLDAMDFAAMIPLQVQSLLDQNPQGLDSIHTLIIGGAPLGTGLTARLQLYSGRAFETYSMTEAATHVALRQINGRDAQPWFTALPGVKFTSTEAGRLRITADHLNSELMTNDSVDLKSDTQFIWLGRADNVVNSGGIKLHPESIEAKTQEVITGRHFFIGEADELLGERLVMALEGSPLDEAEEKQLLQNLRQVLSKFEMPKQIISIPQFEETETGKVKRKLR